MHFYFRVDSDPKIGSGHYARCLSFACFLNSIKKKVTFITKSAEIQNQNSSLKKQVETKLINPKNKIEDIKKTLKIVLKKKNSYLITDGYQLWGYKTRSPKRPFMITKNNQRYIITKEQADKMFKMEQVNA